MTPSTEGYAPANGMQMYWRSLGSGGVPLLLVHGGFGLADAFGDLLDQLAQRRRVIAVELQGHGHTRDIDRAFSFEAFGDDLAALMEHLGVEQADVLGYSLGGATSLRAAIQHPARVRRLVVVSAPFRRSGWFPDVLAAFDATGSDGFPMLQNSPMHIAYAAVAPDPDGFPSLMDKTGALLRRDYDWSHEIAGLQLPVLLVYADADSIPPAHAAAFFALVGGGLSDPGWDGSRRPSARLAILPGRTHYNVTAAPELPGVVEEFLRA